MPRPDLFAVRSAVELTDKQSHRVLVFAALDDITARRRPRWQWTHPTLARQLGISDTFTSLTGHYLDYRRTRDLSTERAIRLHGENSAQLYQLADGMPLDLIHVNAGAEREQQLMVLFKEATHRKVRVDADAIESVEKYLGRACGMAWVDLAAAFSRQRTAQDKEPKAA
ncbi:hypothetical protein ABZS76_33000 [Streptomyces sp. NPDC005562]|uniref:hypothetical protein n=1 Tax=Streptomyces sp. NPDC005562 TaxID=3154890 RepID=UPI0033BE6817